VTGEGEGVEPQRRKACHEELVERQVLKGGGRFVAARFDGCFHRAENAVILKTLQKNL